jgi:hypothetical protein
VGDRVGFGIDDSGFIQYVDILDDALNAEQKVYLDQSLANVPPMTRYRLVFDVTQSGFRNWGFPAFGGLFIIIGIGLVYFRD